MFGAGPRSASALGVLRISRSRRSPEPALAGRPPPPAIGSQVVQDPAQIALKIGLNPVPAANQPFQRRLQQIFAVGPAPRERDCRPHELVASLGQAKLSKFGSYAIQLP
jgi:hypothetical protein